MAREIVAPKGDSVDFEHSQATEVEVWAMIKTTRGDMLFDGVDLSTGVTHHIYVRWNDAFTFEDRVRFEGFDYEILDVENLDEDNEFALIRCKKSGATSQKVSSL